MYSIYMVWLNIVPLFVRFIGVSGLHHHNSFDHRNSRSAGVVGPVANPTNTEMLFAKSLAPATGRRTVEDHSLSTPTGTPNPPTRAVTRISRAVG